MKPLDVIKQGIVDNNIEMIAEGFTQLTGEVVEPAGVVDIESDNVVADESTRLKSSLDDSFIASPKSGASNLGKKRLARTEAIVTKENQFTDDGTEARDINTPEYTPSPRTRGSVNLVDIACHICGSKSMVSETMVYGEFYRCDNCVRK
jgi:hypothetical protein